MKDSHRRLPKVLLPFFCGLVLVGVLCAQRAFKQYPTVEYGESIPVPPDWRQPGEWAFARLMYPPGPNDGYRGRFDGDWRLGMSLWTQDAPAADRAFAAAVRRLTRIDARSVEEDVNLDDGDEVYNWPWLYAVQVGEWGITQHQADVLRDYLLRGGFFMADDFHGAYEWQMFLQRIRMVFPDRPITEIPNNDPIFHTIYDLDERYQIPGAEHLRLGYKRPDYPQGPDDGKGAHWYAIRDDKGRIMVAISFNSDIGDSWEWSNRPVYPERYSDLGFRIGINYVVYAMTH
ncbi:MAG: DUF4159 domain-containing protein [Candidatus Acidiferrales bacterium]